MTKKFALSVLATALLTSPSMALSPAEPEDGLEVVDLGAVEGAYETYPTGMNSHGLAVVVNRNLWSQNIRFDLIDPELFPERDLDDPSDDTYRVVRNALNAPNGFGLEPASQKLATQVSHLWDGQVVALTEFDSIDPDTNRETDSVNYIANDINDLDVIVGSAGEPYERRWTTDRSGEEVQYFMRESFPRAFVREGTDVTFLPGVGNDLFQGGTGTATSLNNQNQVVGFAAVMNSPGLDARIELCQEAPDEDAETSASFEELTVCVWRFWYNQEIAPVANGQQRNPIFVEQAHLWQQDEQGAWTAEHLGAFEAPEPEDEDTPRQILTSRAYDINEQGIAVGTAQRVVTFINGAQNVLVSTSVVYQDGEMIDLQTDYDSRTSVATAINDNNVVVGYTRRNVNGQARDRAFVVNLDDREAGLQYPNGFFNSSTWRPRAINNNNMIVGQGEVSTQQTPLRPTVGFLYDLEQDTIVNLNDMLPCDSGYSIIDAVDINDRGDILAIAATDIAIPIDGEEDVSQRLRAVRLHVSDNEQACQIEEEQFPERQGASIQPWSVAVMALMALLITVRRRIARH